MIYMLKPTVINPYKKVNNLSFTDLEGKMNFIRIVNGSSAYLHLISTLQHLECIEIKKINLNSLNTNF